MKKPNIVFIFADEWRAQATGYNGDVNCNTPVLDRLAGESINVSRAVSGASVCCPYRASLMTGQYPLTHGVFINDVELAPSCYSIARAFNDGGYRTAYIGKWHIYGSPDGQCGRRGAYVPRDYQLGFDDWWGFECCHNYWKSPYYYNDDPTKRMWEGYDLYAQSDHAADYIRKHAGDEQPFMLMLSWGPPHFPLHTAPEKHREAYAEREIELRPNVPPDHREQAVQDLRGYYAHIAAMDEGLQTVLQSIDEAGITDDTMVIVTSDHGEMAESHGLHHKLYPFDESVCVPFLLRWPAAFGRQARECPAPLDAPDIMPTLLSLCGLPVPDTVEGRDWAGHIRGEQEVTAEDAAFMQMPAAFTKLQNFGMQPYRGLRTKDITYARSTDGPWLLYDNAADPYQMHNLVNEPSAQGLRERMEALLQQWLEKLGDAFLPGETYLKQAGLTHYKEVHFPVKQVWEDPWAAANGEWQAGNGERGARS